MPNLLRMKDIDAAKHTMHVFGTKTYRSRGLELRFKSPLPKWVLEEEICEDILRMAESSTCAIATLMAQLKPRKILGQLFLWLRKENQGTNSWGPCRNGQQIMLSGLPATRKHVGFENKNNYFSNYFSWTDSFSNWLLLRLCFFNV